MDKQEKCENCNGKGVVAFSYGSAPVIEDCENCKGVGYIDVKPLSYEDYQEKYGAKHD